MDPRIEARRRDVKEGAARRSLGRLMRWLVMAAVVGLLAWAIQSPPFQVETISVFGVGRSGAEMILSEAGVVVGRPLVMVRPSAVEEALIDDPWVLAATVGVVFPDIVEVRVSERSPVAWVSGDGVRYLMADDGRAVPGDGVEDRLPVIVLPDVRLTAVGDLILDDRVVGALEFLSALAPGVSTTGEMVELGGELWFLLPDTRVRLGRPIEMAEKAAALTALLQRGVPPGSTVHLIAPTRPAIEVEETGSDE